MSKIRRTLIVGLGERGARVVGDVQRELDARTGGLPVVRCLAVVTDEAAVPPGVAGIVLPLPSSMEPGVPGGSQSGAPGTGFAATEPQAGEPLNVSKDDAAVLTDTFERLSAFFRAELLEAHRLAHDRDCVRRGWPVARGPGAAACVVADLGDSLAAAWFVTIARLLRKVAEQRVPQGVALCGVALLPDPTGHPGTLSRLAAAHLGLQALERAQAAALPLALAWLDGGNGDEKTGDTNLLPPFNEGCYLLTMTNEDGLAADGETEMEEMMAAWLVELLLTPLGLALDGRTPLGGGSDLGSFGLAGWCFPADELAAYLAARLQAEMINALLAPPAGGEQLALAAFRQGDPSPPALWPDGVRFPVTPDRFIPPDLRHLDQLMRQVNAAVEAATEDLAAAQARDMALEEAVTDGLAVLRAATDALVDAPDGGLAAAVIFLESLARVWQQETAHAVDRAADARQRIVRLDAPLAEAGTELERVLACFPPWRLTAWLRLLTQPWHIFRLLSAYQEIGERLAVFLAVHQARWLLKAESLEADWQAAFYHRLVEAAEEQLEQVGCFCRGVAGLREELSGSQVLHGDDVGRLLETSALPPGLAGHYYRRAVGDAGQALTALMAVYGPLSRWLAEDLPPAELAQLTGEYAVERFSFLQDEVRLDELLARTYTGAELKARLQELLVAARPFWYGDETPLTSDERAEAMRALFVGLPQPASSPLAGLLAEIWPEVSLYDGGNPHRITAVQVRRGLPLRMLRARADYEAVWKMMRQCRD